MYCRFAHEELKILVKPNEQNEACFSYAMARKHPLKGTIFERPTGSPPRLMSEGRGKM